jgi:hypothetical protein
MQRDELEIQQVRSAIRDFTLAITDVLRAEVHLAKTEIKQAGGELGHQIARIAIFAGIAILGILPFLAFLVIGLGQLLNGNYLLSSLIVSVVFIAVGGGVAYSSFSQLRGSDFDFTLPETRGAISEGFAEEANLVDQKIHQISEAAKRRQA